MAESILNTIKKMLNIDSEDTSFDVDILIHINTAFFVLCQLGVGTNEAFSIASADNTWSEFVLDSKNLEAIKTYIYLKVRIVFDPPTSSAVMQAFNDLIKEYESRLNTMFDIPKEDNGCSCTV